LQPQTLDVLFRGEATDARGLCLLRSQPEVAARVGRGRWRRLRLDVALMHVSERVQALLAGADRFDRVRGAILVTACLRRREVGLSLHLLRLDLAEALVGNRDEIVINRHERAPGGAGRCAAGGSLARSATRTTQA